MFHGLNESGGSLVVEIGVAAVPLARIRARRAAASYRSLTHARISGFLNVGFGLRNAGLKCARAGRQGLRACIMIWAGGGLWEFNLRPEWNR